VHTNESDGYCNTLSDFAVTRRHILVILFQILEHTCTKIYAFWSIQTGKY